MTGRYLGVMLCVACGLAYGQRGDIHREWRWYLGDQGSSQYSSLSQINTKNVGQLEQVWLYRSGGEQQIQCNPIVIGGLLYGVSAERNIFALRADTGEEVWTFAPPEGQGSTRVVRGLQYWEAGEDRRIYAVLGTFIHALNAKTGKPIVSFGEDGALNIRGGYDRDVEKLSIASSTPGVIYKNTIIVCTTTSEGHPAAPGDILAFDVLSGERKWVFHTIPRPGEYGYYTWPAEAWKKTGGANCWAGMTLDAERGIVYVPTGSAVFDFYGGDRIGDNLFANSLIALNVETGERIWHFQTVRHDLWDRDVPAPPNLLTVEHDGKRIDAVAQITKSAHVFLFDRETGEPLFPIEERPVSREGVPGEFPAKTQPVPLKPPAFSRQVFDEDLVTERTPEAHTAVLERLRRSKTGEPFIPPSLEGTVIYPGFDGGGEWGGAAVDPETGLLYINASEMPWILTLFEVPVSEDGDPNTRGRRVYAQNCVYCHGPDLKGNALQEFPPLLEIEKKYTPEQMTALIRTGKERMPSFDFLDQGAIDAVVKFVYELDATNEVNIPVPNPATGELDEERWYTSTGYHRFVDPDGYPAVKPPWGTLNAIDMNTGEIVWKSVLGENPELENEAYRNGGTENYGGPVVTAGGLVFIAATKDAHLRAFNKKTGEELWKAPLPHAGFATPCTYETGGRQYVVVAAAGGKIGVPAGDAYVAFALPAK